jgi:hypothetical protein
MTMLRERGVGSEEDQSERSGARWPELLIVLMGALLRVGVLLTNDVAWGYDYPDHWTYIDWASRNFGLPPLDLSREAYHPPLYYAVAGWLVRGFHATPQQVGAFSVFCGIAQLGVLWYGLDRYLKGSPVARRTGLALAAVLPAAVHMNGMVMAEALNSLLSLVALLLMVRMFRPAHTGRWVPALVMGAVLAAELLTKISALTLVAAAGVATVLDLVWAKDHHARALVRRAGPSLGALAVLLALAGWYPVYNLRTYGQAFVSGYEGPDRQYLEDMEEIPYFQRRPLATYLLTWTTDIYESPFYPTSVAPKPRFFPQLIATTFADYYNYRFSGEPRPPEPALFRNEQWVSLSAERLAAASVLAGTAIALLTVAAWCAAAFRVVRRRRLQWVPVLLVPLIALIGQLHFTIRVPIDMMGPVKGTYLLFASGPLFALFGVAVDWLWRRSRLLGFAAMATLLPLLTYSAYRHWP